MYIKLILFDIYYGVYKIIFINLFVDLIYIKIVLLIIVFDFCVICSVIRINDCVRQFGIVFGVKVFGDYLVNRSLFRVFGDGQIDFIFDEYWEVVIDVRNFYYDGGIVVFFWVFEITNIG